MRTEQKRFGPQSAVLEQVAEDVFVYVQPNGGWCLNNAGLVTGGDTNVLVDTAATQARAERLRDEVVNVAGRAPSLVVNTHHHGDHIFGNGFFAPPATILAHERARTEIIESGLGLQLVWPDVDWGEISLVPPTMTIADALTVYAGELRLEVFHVGPAHTTNDLVIWVPGRNVLFCGDVALSGSTPFCLMGSIDGSLRALARLRALRPATVVPGHGPVAGPEVLDTAEMYLQWLTVLARKGYEAGLSPLETAHEADLGEFAGLLDSERLVGNLHRAYAELAEEPLGAPLDVLQPFKEMAVYNGGPPTCHA